MLPKLAAGGAGALKTAWGGVSVLPRPLLQPLQKLLEIRAPKGACSMESPQLQVGRMLPVLSPAADDQRMSELQGAQR